MGSGLGSSQGPPGRRSTTNEGMSEGFVWSLLSGARCALSLIGNARFERALHKESVRWLSTGMNDENDQAERAISTGKLNALLRLHTRPINVVVFHGSSGRTRFEVGFPLRCLQRLSRPYIATLHCGWRHNRSTRGTSTPVLSY